MAASHMTAIKKEKAQGLKKKTGKLKFLGPGYT
jgi:hypothetical protein